MIRHFLHFGLLLLATSAHADDRSGEAKASSENAMKKVEDGDPVLTQNMMQHMMMAQMYEAQMNFPMAAQERMKAQMLQQQIQTNDQSRDKNKDRRDNAVFSSDKSQSQTTGPILGGLAPSGTSQALGSFFGPAPEPKPSVQEQVSNEFLTFDEGVKKPIEETSTATVETSKSESPTESPKEVTSVSPERAAELVADLKSVEAQYSDNAVATATSAEPETEVVAPVRVIQAPSELVVAKKQKERDEFWKDPKAVNAKKRAGKRAIASTKKTTKSPNRSQIDNEHRSSPLDRKPH